MADIALGGVEKLVKVALAIQEAVETVKQNDKECRAIEKCATRCTALLKRLEEKTADMMKDEVMRAPLEDVADSLEESLELVKLCQRKQNKISHLWKAADMAKELRRVQDDILRKVQLGHFATTIQTTIVLINNQNDPPQPTLPTSYSEEVVPGFTRFSLYDLRTATNNFSDQNIIGTGGTAIVYRGIQHCGQEVAIKKIQMENDTTNEEKLYYEINVFLNLQHNNIIRPMGYCDETVSVLVYSKEKGRYVRAESHTFCFVEEYMPNRCMEESFLRGPRLDWSSYFRILQGVAQGVHYLHKQRVIHLDLKPHNILLDSDMNPRISDFGLAIELMSVDQEIIRSGFLSGTPGYMSPEHVGEGISSIKCDVYAFGIIIIRTICCMSINESPDPHDFDGWVGLAQDTGRMKELFGAGKVDRPQLMEIKRCIVVGLLCTRFDRHKRPTMADVVLMLSGKKEIPIPEEAFA